MNFIHFAFLIAGGYYLYATFRDYNSTRINLKYFGWNEEGGRIRENNKVAVAFMRKFGWRLGLILKTVLVDFVVLLLCHVCYQMTGRNLYVTLGLIALLLYRGYGQWKAADHNEKLHAQLMK